MGDVPCRYQPTIRRMAPWAIPHAATQLTYQNKRVLDDRLNRSTVSRRLDPYLLLVVVTSAVAALPLLGPYFVGSHDGVLAVYRFFEFDRSIQDGVLIPRWAPDLFFGYGYPFFNFYAPLSYYVAEIFHHLGAGFVGSVSATFALGFVLSGVTMYLLARDLGGRWAGLLASLAYVFAPYHLVNAHLRGDLAEFFAFVWFPAILWAAGRLIARRSLGYLALTAVLYAALVVAVLFPDSAMAQAGAVSETRWGVSGSFSSPWRFPQSVANVVAGDNKTDLKVDIPGWEFTVGFVRGRVRGGDWGVSFIRKAFKKGSTAVEERERCFGGAMGELPPCLLEKTTEIYNNATFPGVEAHWFIPVVRIGNRVQVGLNLAGGGVRPSGTMRKVRDEFIRPSNGEIIPVHTEETLNMSDDWGPFLPVFKIEGQAAVTLGPGFKLKVGGGLSFPGAGFRVMGTHFFGTR